jgi:gliding motility-associated-like protein
VFIPTAFTPNGDGENELFRGTAVGIKEYELIIFNRWGEVMFQSTDPTEGWDGNHPNGKEAIEGVYAWSVYAKGQNDVLILKKGQLTLFR